VLDEAMVWAATWSYKRFCLCAELTIRYRLPAPIGQPLSVRAGVESSRPRLTLTTGQILDPAGNVLCQASAKYVPLTDADNHAMLATLVPDPATAPAAVILQRQT
jgi:hypothetical protein